MVARTKVKIISQIANTSHTSYKAADIIGYAGSDIPLKSSKVKYELIFDFLRTSALPSVLFLSLSLSLFLFHALVLPQGQRDATNARI